MDIMLRKGRMSGRQALQTASFKKEERCLSVPGGGRHPDKKGLIPIKKNWQAAISVLLKVA